jgi:tRNA/tmRNA/rRNA uracil-C5-methylase (TrmA/RlmC/RlmD family)
VALKTGDTVVLKISDIAFGGDGVARVEDFVVFVPFVIVGEEVEAVITEVKRRFARAKPVRILTAAPERVAPACRYFGACGGCQYQHLAYPAQLDVKRRQIAELFRRIGGFEDSRIAPVIPCPQPYAYRNRLMIRSQWNKPEQRLNVGFVRWDCGLVEDVDECRIAEPAINEQIRQVRAHPPPKGGIKVVLRIAPEGWEVPADSFFQTNFFLLPRLVETVRERVRQGGARHLIDLYCGVGFFGIELAALVESFVGVEYDRKAVESARRNAEARGLGNGEFIASGAQEALPELWNRFLPGQTVVVLDPPRKGCAGALLQTLRQAHPAQVIYVSCHPATMARDLNVLCGGGVFTLAEVVPLDMFPQTQHLECVADLRSSAV